MLLNYYYVFVTILMTVLLDIRELISFAHAIHCIGLWRGKSAAQKVKGAPETQFIASTSLSSPAKVPQSRNRCSAPPQFS